MTALSPCRGTGLAVTLSSLEVIISRQKHFPTSLLFVFILNTPLSVAPKFLAVLGFLVDSVVWKKRGYTYSVTGLKMRCRAEACSQRDGMWVCGVGCLLRDARNGEEARRVSHCGSK